MENKDWKEDFARVFSLSGIHPELKDEVIYFIESLLISKQEEMEKAVKNTSIYFALIEVYNQHKSMFPGFVNEVDFASFIDNKIT